MVTMNAVGPVTAAIGPERVPFETVPTPAVPAVVSASAIAEGGAERARQMTGRVVHALFEADRIAAEPAANPALFFVERAPAPALPATSVPGGGTDEAGEAQATAEAAEAQVPAEIPAAAEEAASLSESGPETLLFQRFYSSRQTFVESVAGAWGSGTEATTMLVADFDKRILKVRFFQDAAGDAASDATFFYVSSNGRYRGSLLLA